MSKYTLVHQYLLDRAIIDRADVFTPDEVSFADLERVHTAEYLAALREDRLDAMARRRLGVPWSSRMLRRSRLAVQGTLTAARHALADGLAGNLAGGTHHAFSERGEGFCVLNDVAAGDRYGRFALTEPGVRERESQVIGALRSAGLPLAIVLAGGYAATAERTAQLHTLVFDAARTIWNARGAIHERQ
jgi:acetoin utilization deacetylase AcuC-like enzyme